MGKLRTVECFLLDMDGVVYLGEELIEGTRDFFTTLKNQNKSFYFLTNNSSRSASSYQEKLHNLGIQVDLDMIITSGQVTADYILSQQENPTVYLVGTPSLKKEMESAGIRVTDKKEGTIDYLVLGFDTTLTYQKLWDAHDLLQEGIPYLATNPDYVCPLEGGQSMPDCGSIISLLKTSSGREPFVIGKPNTLMVDYLVSKTAITRDKLAFIGDRLYTDIKTASNSGIISILVLSGETKKTDLTATDQQPDYIFPSLQEVNDFLNGAGNGII